MVSLEGSILPLASKVTVNGAGQEEGETLILGTTVYFEFTFLTISLNGL